LSSRAKDRDVTLVALRTSARRAGDQIKSAHLRIIHSSFPIFLANVQLEKESQEGTSPVPPLNSTPILRISLLLGKLSDLPE
jgi:hypothetical protein